MPPPTTTDPTRDALEAMVEEETRRGTECVDTLHVTAMGLTRVAQIPLEELPRLLVSAACRGLERLMERHMRLLARAEAGDVRAQNEIPGLQALIEKTAGELDAALSEGLSMVSQLRKNFGAYGRADN